MVWATLNFSRTQVDKSGDTLTNDKVGRAEKLHAMEILSNWRSSYSFPLNTIKTNLRQRALVVDEDVIIAQRLKRSPSIIRKLKKGENKRLSTMQDIGGCRAVVADVKSVYMLKKKMLGGRMRHDVKSVDDYMERPKMSGYRGLHIVYRYNSERNANYNKHLIEVQIRSALQHVWATTVETMGSFLNQALKSSEGEENWLRFFKLMSHHFAEIEGTPLVLDRVSSAEVNREILVLSKLLDVKEKLLAYRGVKSYFSREKHNYDYCILQLNTEKKTVNIIGFKKKDLVAANKKYLELEEDIFNKDKEEVVLISTKSLRKAYPNYFADTGVFISYLDAIKLA